MSDSRGQELSDLLKDAGLGWLVKDVQNADGLLQVIDAASAVYAARFASAENLWDACKAAPEVMRAFLQALAAGVSPPLLAMVARILLHDAWVMKVDFAFASHRDIALHVEIEDLEGGRQSFHSREVWDAEVLRHFGLMKVGDKPVIHGYYAAKLR